MRRRGITFGVGAAGLFGAVALLLASATALAATFTLTAVQYPEKRSVDVAFVRTEAAPRGTLKAEVRFKEGQSEINVKFTGMKPAVLFGGDVTSYVVWAVTREGKTTNLGELWVREADDSASYTTGLKEFAMLVTAETHPLVDEPSELVMFYSAPVAEKTARNTQFSFSAFVAAPPHDHASLADVEAGAAGAQDLQQAKKAYELAQREGAETYAPKLMQEAAITLAQATNLATTSTLSKGMRDYSRRTVALASEAIRTTLRKKEAEQLAQEIARRKAEMEALKTRAAQAESEVSTAESKAAAAAAQALAAEQQKATLEAQTAKLTTDMTALQSEKSSLEQGMAALRAEREGLLAEQAKLAAEKQALADRLKGALDQVANTQASARGYIVNLPDILFDVNEATLKPEARVTLAKLSGILLMMPALNARIEGHTDSTGSASYNLDLSKRRAGSVLDFLAVQGVSATRLTSAGYGMERPVADNSTREGRAKNRRVEIVIAEGEVKEAAPGK